MRERAEELRGRLQVAHREGTTVTAELPLPLPSAAPVSAVVPEVES
jgi:hypothetical protein